MSKPGNAMQLFKRRRDYLFIPLILIFLGILAYLDSKISSESLLFEGTFTTTILIILISGFRAQSKHPDIKQFGWDKIMWGFSLLLFGSLVDIVDDPQSLQLINSLGIPLERSWIMAMCEKFVGNTSGLVLLAIGVNQWVPWMIQTRQKLAHANQNLSRILMSLDEHIENVRLNISRELHDDIAQQLTSLGFQLQLAQKDIDKNPEAARERLKAIGKDLSEALKTVRQISRDLRPEALFALGIIPALEKFLDKMRTQNPDVELDLQYQWLEGAGDRVRLETMLDEQNLLHLYRVLQEGVRNALKHARAKHIWLNIREEPDQFCFVIEDDGTGLPWEKIPSDEQLIQEGHLGIVGLRERVRELSGRFELGRRKPGGVRMEVQLSK